MAMLLETFRMLLKRRVIRIANLLEEASFPRWQHSPRIGRTSHLVNHERARHQSLRGARRRRRSGRRGAPRLDVEGFGRRRRRTGGGVPGAGALSAGTVLTLQFAAAITKVQQLECGRRPNLRPKGRRSGLVFNRRRQLERVAASTGLPKLAARQPVGSAGGRESDQRIVRRRRVRCGVSGNGHPLVRATGSSSEITTPCSWSLDFRSEPCSFAVPG